MNPRQLLPTLVLAATSAAALVACGSSNQANTVATTPPVSAPSPQTTTSAAPATTPTQTTTPRTTPQTTRTAPAPAFVQTQPQPGTQLAAAVGVANHAGYTVRDTSTYKTDQTLRVLVGTKAGAQQAFFFVNDRYIGTDAGSPSASLSVVAQNDTAVTLRYGLYGSGRQSQSGSKTVQFVLNNGHLTPLDTIPPVSSSSGGRR